MNIAAGAGLFAVLLAPAIAGDADDWRIEKLSLAAVLGREPTAEQVSASLKWTRCIDHAADIFARQPEPAETVADAAINSCSWEMMPYMKALGIRYPESVKEATRPDLIARVMALRAITARPSR